MSLLLSVKKVAKDFHGVLALKSVDFELRTHEVHAVCGENGAGKSTLMKILSGVYPYGTYQGEILYKNSPLEFYNTRESQQAGISIVYQELSSVANRSVVENLFLGAEIQNMGFVAEDAMITRAQELLQPFQLKISPHTLLSELSIGERQMIEIAKALRSNPSILILDEPTSALTDKETQVLFQVLRQLKEKGLGIVIITHRLNEVFTISDKISVLRDGQSIGTWDAKNLSEEQLITSMVGRQIKDLFPDRPTPSQEVSLQVKDWTAYDPNQSDKILVHDINFELHKGEVLGIAGLMGAGRTELLMSLFGVIPHSKGSMYLNGNPLIISSPKEAIDQGVALVSEDRKRYGLMLEADLPTNITLSALNRVSSSGYINSHREMRESQKLIEKFKVKTSTLKNLAQNLSGGNQQKIVVAKCLFAQPKVLFMDEPTRGIDVGARLELYQIIQELAKSGMSVLVASSELPELLGTCHRIIVLCEGKISAILSREEATEEKIMAAATRFRQRILQNEGVSHENPLSI